MNATDPETGFQGREVGTIIFFLPAPCWQGFAQLGLIKSLERGQKQGPDQQRGGKIAPSELDSRRLGAFVDFNRLFRAGLRRAQLLRTSKGRSAYLAPG